jgi:hypothetical protein
VRQTDSLGPTAQVFKLSMIIHSRVFLLEVYCLIEPLSFEQREESL